MLLGGIVYNITVVIIMENADQIDKAEDTVPITVLKRGVKAVVSPTQLKVSHGRKFSLNGIMSQDLDNRKSPMRVSIVTLH